MVETVKLRALVDRLAKRREQLSADDAARWQRAWEAASTATADTVRFPLEDFDHLKALLRSTAS